MIPRPRLGPPPLEDAVFPRTLICPEENLLSQAVEPSGKAAPRPIQMSEGRLTGWLPLFPWLPGTKYIFFLIGLAADGYLASRESERDFVSNTEK